MRRWLRRIGIALLALIVVLTSASFAFNELTNGRERPAAALYRGPYVVVARTRLAYRHWGASGSPVVLLGGFVEPTWVWDRVAPLLARRHRVYAVDLPPFGYSQRRGPYTVEHWDALVEAFDRRLRIARPGVVGHSLGAAVAASIAFSKPRDVSSIVLLDGDALPIGGAPRWAAHLIVDPYYTSIFRIVTGSDRLVGRILRGALAPDAPKPRHAELELWERQFRVAGTAHAFRDLASSGHNGISLAELRGIRVPSLVAWGRYDTVDDLTAGRTTARMLRAPFVVIPKAGHLSMLGNPRAVAAAIERRSGA